MTINENFPQGWESTNLGNIVFVEWGNTSITKKSYSKQGYTAYSATGPDGLLIHFEREGQGIILSAIGAKCGKCFFANGKWTAIKNTIVIQGNPIYINHKFFHFFLNDQTKWILSGSGQPFITLATARETIIPIPPLAEQKRIVAKLDALMARSSRAREELARIPRLIERYKQAVLAAAFRGDLTADWRRGTDLKNWQEISLGEIITGIQAGKNLKCEERPPQPHEQGVVKVSAVTWGRFQANETKTFLPGHIPDPRFLIQAGDFLISRANTIELVGACVIVENTPENLFLSDKILRLAMPEELKPWVLFYLRSSEGRKQIEAASTGNQLSMRNISQDSIKSIRLPLPPQQERLEILRRLTTSMDAFSNVNEERIKAEALRGRLEQATLAKAFRGELVAQDPADEPASVLLERIRAERAAAQPKPARKKATTKT